ncbi:hypothetical protein KCP78_13170 [Salmonella enterica subsp. enterica]|nr:hypothetical protein KCP78_13170 [Salmonella enterica subsp. enterica]
MRGPLVGTADSVLFQSTTRRGFKVINDIERAKRRHGRGVVHKVDGAKALVWAISVTRGDRCLPLANKLGGQTKYGGSRWRFTPSLPPQNLKKLGKPYRGYRSAALPLRQQAVRRVLSG